MGNGIRYCSCFNKTQRICTDVHVDDDDINNRTHGSLALVHNDKQQLNSASDSERRTLVDLKYSHEYNALTNERSKCMLVDKDYNADIALELVMKCLGDETTNDLNCVVILIKRFQREITKIEKGKFVEYGLKYYLNYLERVNYTCINKHKQIKVKKLLLEILAMIVSVFHRSKQINNTNNNEVIVIKDNNIVYLIHLMQTHLIQILKPSTLTLTTTTRNDVLNIERNLQITNKFISDITNNAIT